MLKMEPLDKGQRLAQCDALLDTSAGSALLRTPPIAALVVDALLHFDGDRYAMIAWCVMPNHVHVVLEPRGDHALSQIIKSWKAFTAARINKTLGRVGRLWAPDYFDRFMRSEEHLTTTIAYVENNPVAAGLCSSAADWPFSSAAARC
ncbi:MAG: transposase [Hyphomonadaceae bacterium]|nr:transposase [Hyphomonadaceae bacterium]